MLLLLKINRLSVRIIKPYQIILVGLLYKYIFEYFAAAKILHTVRTYGWYKLRYTLILSY